MPPTHRTRLQSSQSALPRPDWASGAVLSGFVATVAGSAIFTLAYGLSEAVGNTNGTMVARWFAALGQNDMTRMAGDHLMLAVSLNLLLGLVLAFAYGRFAEPMLTGPAWRKGVVFALVPWLVSISVFLPLWGGGLFGTSLGAGPLPILGNLALHIVYGLVLGSVYALSPASGADDSATDRAIAAAAQRATAFGLTGGIALGVALAATVAPTLVTGGRDANILAWALLGGALGAAFDSVLGLADRGDVVDTSDTLIPATAPISIADPVHPVVNVGAAHRTR